MSRAILLVLLACTDRGGVLLHVEPHAKAQSGAKFEENEKATESKLWHQVPEDRTCYCIFEHRNIASARVKSLEKYANA